MVLVLLGRERRRSGCEIRLNSKFKNCSHNFSNKSKKLRTHLNVQDTKLGRRTFFFFSFLFLLSKSLFFFTHLDILLGKNDYLPKLLESVRTTFSVLKLYPVLFTQKKKKSLGQGRNPFLRCSYWNQFFFASAADFCGEWNYNVIQIMPKKLDKR